MHQFRSLLRVFLVAAVATALTVPVRVFVFGKLLDIRAPFLPFLLAVVLATWLAGIRSGLCATVFSAAAASYPLIMRTGLRGVPTTFQIKLVIFVFIGGLTSWLVASLHTAQRRIAADNDNSSAR